MVARRSERDAVGGRVGRQILLFELREDKGVDRSLDPRLVLDCGHGLLS